MAKVDVRRDEHVSWLALVKPRKCAEGTLQLHPERHYDGHVACGVSCQWGCALGCSGLSA